MIGRRELQGRVTGGDDEFSMRELGGSGRRRRRLRRRWRLVRTGRATSPVLRVALLLGLLGLLWCGWQAFQVKRDLDDATARAAEIRSLLEQGDAAGAGRALGMYQDAADTAERRTDGLTWKVLETIPLVGDDAEGVRVAAAVLAAIGQDGLSPLVGAAELVTAEVFQPIDGVFPVDRIAALEDPVAQSEAAFDNATTRLDGVDSSHFVGRFRVQFDELRELVGNAHDTLSSTHRATRVLPSMLGDSRPRRFLMVLQNNAELRSGGGLPGALSLVKVNDGRIKIVEQIDTAQLGTTPDPVVPLTAEETDLFGSILGRVSVDATLTPDFPRAAEILRARWQLVKGVRVDGVLFVDPIAVSYLLRGTGAVNVPGFPPVSSDNFVGAVENQIYLQSNDAAVHSRYQQAVAKAVFDVFAQGGGDTVSSLRGLVAGVAEGRIRVHSFDEQEQAEIAGTEIAGELSAEEGSGPDIGVYINDAGPTKMQYYLRYDTELSSRKCDDRRQVLSGTVAFHSDTPTRAELLPNAVTGKGFPGQRVKPGHQLLVVYLMSPVGGEIDEIRIAGKVFRPTVKPLAGRYVAPVAIALSPQARESIEFTMRSGAGQEGNAHMRVTPGAFPANSNVQATSACKIR